MKKRMFVIALAAVVAMTSAAWAGQEDAAQDAETAQVVVENVADQQVDGSDNAKEAELAQEDLQNQTDAQADGIDKATEQADGDAAAEIVSAENANEDVAAEDIGTDLVPEDEETADTISGYYIENYAQAQSKVNLNIISESDLVAAAQQAGTTIYNFRKDGKVEIYDATGRTIGNYTAEEGTLTITADDTKDYGYEFIDSLLVIRDGEESAVLYSFAIQDLEHITIADYDTIEIDETTVAVTDESVESYINTVLQGQTTYEQIEEGTIENGDIITISYEGVLEGEQEPFEGGTSQGITLLLGQGALIEGFEEQLEGKAIGDTVDVQVTFPEDYTGNEDLIGKNATFATTIMYKTVANTPELTDEWVQEFSAQYLPQPLETVEEFREYSREYLGEYLLHTAILNALAQRTAITAYNSNVSQMLLSYSSANLAYTASYYGYDAETYASMVGYNSAEAYAQAEAISYMNISAIANKVLSDQDILYTADDLDEGLASFLRLSASPYTVEEYKDQASTADMWIYTNLEYKYNLAMSSLEDRVVLVPHVEEEPAEE